MDQFARRFFAECKDLRPLNDTLIKFLKNCKWGIARRDGTTVLPPEQDHIVKISNTFLLVWKGDRCGIFSMKTCRLVISVNCDYVAHQEGNSFRIWRGGETKLVSVDRQQRAEPLA